MCQSACVGLCQMEQKYVETNTTKYALKPFNSHIHTKDTTKTHRVHSRPLTIIHKSDSVHRSFHNNQPFCTHTKKTLHIINITLTSISLLPMKAAMASSVKFTIQTKKNMYIKMLSPFSLDITVKWQVKKTTWESTKL